MHVYAQHIFFHRTDNIDDEICIGNGNKCVSAIIRSFHVGTIHRRHHHISPLTVGTAGCRSSP